jgi:hypothetical protein
MNNRQAAVNFNELISKIDNNQITKLSIRASRYYELPDLADNNYRIVFRVYDDVLKKNQIDVLLTILNKIQNNSSIKELSLNGFRVKDNAYTIVAAISNLLKENKYLDMIEFNNSKFKVGLENTKFDLSEFLNCLNNNSTIRSLIVDDNTFPMNPNKNKIFLTNQLCQWLSKHQFHPTLQLCFNNIVYFDVVLNYLMDANITIGNLIIKHNGYESPPASCVSTLTRFVTESSLQSITFKEYGFSDETDVELNALLFYAILKNPHIKRISIQNTNECFANINLNDQITSTNRREFIFYDCYFNNDFFEKISRIINHSPSLTKLSLSEYNCLGRFIINQNDLSNFDLFLDAIVNHPTLTYLEMPHQQFNSKRLKKLNNCIHKRINPIHLNLSDLFALSKDIDIVQSIATAQQIESFTFYRTTNYSLFFNQNNIDVLLAIIKQNPFLRLLDIRTNNIFNDGAKLIANAILDNPLSAITTVRLEGNFIDDQHMKIIYAAIQQVKFNVSLAIAPFNAFSSVINAGNKYWLPTDVTKKIIYFGLFSSLGHSKRKNEIEQLTNNIVDKAMERAHKMN